MVYYSMTVIWPTLVGSLYTTDVKEIGWMSVSQIMLSDIRDAED